MTCAGDASNNIHYIAKSICSSSCTRILYIKQWYRVELFHIFNGMWHWTAQCSKETLAKWEWETHSHHGTAVWLNKLLLHCAVMKAAWLHMLRLSGMDPCAGLTGRVVPAWPVEATEQSVKCCTLKKKYQLHPVLVYHWGVSAVIISTKGQAVQTGTQHTAHHTQWN